MSGISFFNEESGMQGKPKKYLTLVIYDISDNKRRLKLIRILESYGQRVQKSAFEAMLDQKKFRKLKNAIGDFAVPDDLIKIYYLKGDSQSIAWGDMEEVQYQEVIIV